MSKLFASVSFAAMSAALAGGGMFPVILICLLFDLVLLVAHHVGVLCRTERPSSGNPECRQTSNLPGAGMKTGRAGHFTTSS
jgi:hypothetical protein